MEYIEIKRDKRTLIVNLTIAVNIRFTNHLIDFRIGEFLAYKKFK